MRRQFFGSAYLRRRFAAPSTALIVGLIAGLLFVLAGQDSAAAGTVAVGASEFADAGGTYTVRKGDTLAGIAKSHGCTVAALAAANGLKPPYVLQPGQRLVLAATSQENKKPSAPKAGSSYTVAKGDTLSGISIRTGIPASAIAAANGLASVDLVREGQTLRIPAPGEKVTPKSTATSITTGSYKVRSGDTLGGIARRSGVSVAAIAAANGIRAPQYVIIDGEEIVIPRGGSGDAARSATSKLPTPKGTYDVRKGDTVIGIARRAGVPARSIIAANGLSAPAYMIRAGSTIRIPSVAAASPSAAKTTKGGPTPGSSYRIRKGDTVAQIAARAGVPASAIISANGLRPPKFMITQGQILQIPPAGSTPTAAAATSAPKAAAPWVVKKGDTVSSISKRTGVPSATIIAANGLAPPAFVIREGQTLVLSATPGAPPKGLAPPYEPPWVKGAPVHIPAGQGRHGSREEVGRALERYANRYGLPVDLIKGLAWVESGWKQEAVSNTGAVGVMQLMPGTADWIGEALLRRKLDRFDYQQNVEGGNAYLDWLLSQVGGDERLALASYYQGLGAVRRGGGPSSEGEKYVKLVQGARKKF